MTQTQKYRVETLQEVVEYFVREANESKGIDREFCISLAGRVLTLIDELRADDLVIREGIYEE